MSTPAISYPADVFPTLSNPFGLANPLPKGGVKGIVGESHWQEIQYTEEQGSSFFYEGIIDRSTLDDQGNGEAFLYAKKNSMDHHYIATAVLFASPFYIAGTMIYNALRIVPVALYLIARIPYDYCTQKEGVKHRSFFAVTGHHIAQIGYQTWLSITNIVKAPFYGLGFMFGVLYGLVIDPLNGRKIVAYCETAWNHNISRYRSVWSIFGPMKGFRFEGGGAPDELGKHAYYLPGCYQPFAKVTCIEGNITEIHSMGSQKPYYLKNALPAPMTSWGKRAQIIVALTASIFFTAAAVALTLGAAQALPSFLSPLQQPLSMLSYHQALGLSVIGGVVTLRLLMVAKTHALRSRHHARVVPEKVDDSDQ